MIFLDASVVIAYYLEETYSERVQEIYRQEVELYLSELVELEVFSALSRLVRLGSLQLDAAHRTRAMFSEHLDAGLYARVHLQAGHFRWARDAIVRFDLPLKSPDALHLAAALRAGLRLITADRQLARNAESLGVGCELIES
ncbi:MAG: type II toxin-antitoxin system VapC family toxin [Chloroflexia bacterium]|nr:type II toxin-antitoxin system VapC family toxin [Chloroflexia bacterium]